MEGRSSPPAVGRVAPRPRSPSPAVRIRPARLDDAAALARVMRAAIRGLARGAYPPRLLAAWARLPPVYHRWAMTAGGETLLVAVRGDRVVGYVGVRGAEVTALFVYPGVARRGIAARLLGRVEREAARRGVRRVTVRAARSGEAFYAARGYLPVRRISVPLPGGASLPSRLLATALLPAGPSARRPGCGARSK